MIPEHLPKDKADLMGYAPRAVVHLRAQYHRKRLGLMFGAGLSRGLGFPDWRELVHRLASAVDADAQALFDKFAPEPPAQAVMPRSLASLTHMLFGHFRARYISARLSAGDWAEPITFLNEQHIRSQWLRLIHGALYKDHEADHCKRDLDAHPYLAPYREIIRGSPMTVNYNFDDSLEKLLYFNRTEEEQSKSRGYETTYRPNAQFQRETGVIYHPNGYLPSEFEDGASPSVVFADDSFQDQLIDAAAGRYTHLAGFMQRNTCLLVGLSLEDATLRSLLRQNAISSAGHVHYLVQYTPTDADIDRDAFRAIFESNFTAYNLITLFLNDVGIRSLGELIRLSNDAFDMEYASVTRKFVYYIVGSVGAGKTTATNNFRNLRTYDEWIDARRPELARPESDLTADEILEVNAWVAAQFRMKNYALRKEVEGIHLVDRCPLDPLTFGDRAGVGTKAKDLDRQVTKDGAWPIEQGHVIFLEGAVRDLRNRISFKHRYWSEGDLQSLVDNIHAIYGNVEKSTISTEGKEVQDVIREISHVIFRSEYKPADIGSKLRQLATP